MIQAGYGVTTTDVKGATFTYHDIDSLDKKYLEVICYRRYNKLVV